jgi:hypothetical protein
MLNKRALAPELTTVDVPAKKISAQTSKNTIKTIKLS